VLDKMIGTSWDLGKHARRPRAAAVRRAFGPRGATHLAAAAGSWRRTDCERSDAL